VEITGRQVTMLTNERIASAVPAGTLAHLNWMRGVSAIAVVILHVHTRFFVHFHELDAATVWKKALLALVYFLTSLGHQAVVIFFVLSGFFIGTSVVADSSTNVWSWKKYALRRATRLYVVLLPALVLTVILDIVGIVVLRNPGAYAELDHSPSTFLWSMLFLQEKLAVPFGSNLPLWSLAYEFWAYVSFPLLYRALFGGGPIVWRVAKAGVGLAIVYFWGAQMAFYFGVWALGAIVAMAWRFRSWRGSRVGRLLALGAFIAALLISRLTMVGGEMDGYHLRDIPLAVATALLIAMLHTEEPDPGGSKSLYRRCGEIGAGFAFTLYVTHEPLLAFIWAAMKSPARWQPGSMTAIAAIAISLATILYAFTIARFTEAQTDRVRQAIVRRLTFARVGVSGALIRGREP
jgi:peptidoglycan/LPS O-acetylase OafA/YrhL